MSLTLEVLERPPYQLYQLALSVTERIIRLLPSDSLCYRALNQCYKLSYVTSFGCLCILPEKKNLRNWRGFCKAALHGSDNPQSILLSHRRQIGWGSRGQLKEYVIATEVFGRGNEL